MTWSKRLWPHVAALGVLLALLVPLLDDGAVVSADEGAVLSTLELLRATGEWSMSDPVAEVDPDGRWFGFHLADRSGDRYFPYAKHVVYPAAMAPLYDTGGHRLVLWASAAGTLAAATLGALISRRVRPGIDVVTLWTLGVVSPLFFDSFWVIAHSIGAAFAALAVWAALEVVESRRVRFVAVLAIGVAGAVLFRSEGALYGLALGGALGILGLRRRDPTTLSAAVAAGGFSLAGWWVDSRLATALVGDARAPFRIRTATGHSWWGDRWEGAWSSVLRPQLQRPTAAGAILLAVAVIGVIAALYARRRPAESRLLQGAAVLGACAALATLVLPSAPVPGLLVAFPVLTIGVVLMSRSTVVGTPSRLLVATSALFGLAVLSTQYRVGGAMEWGGRFFHLALPALVPVVVAALVETGARLDRPTRRVAAVSLAVVSGVLTVTAVGSLLRLHDATGSLVDEVVALRQSVRQEGGEGIVVSDMEALGRFAWRDAVGGRYLSVPDPEDLPVVAERLADRGVEQFVFAEAYRHDRDRSRLTGYEPVPGRSVTVGSWHLSVMRREA